MIRIFELALHLNLISLVPPSLTYLPRENDFQALISSAACAWRAQCVDVYVSGFAIRLTYLDACCFFGPNSAPLVNFLREICSIGRRQAKDYGYDYL